VHFFLFSFFPKDQLPAYIYYKEKARSTKVCKGHTHRNYKIPGGAWILLSRHHKLLIYTITLTSSFFLQKIIS